jgi:hypothetical protein
MEQGQSGSPIWKPDCFLEVMTTITSLKPLLEPSNRDTGQPEWGLFNYANLCLSPVLCLL